MNQPTTDIAPRRPVPSVPDRREAFRLRVVQTLFLIGLLAWGSLAAWWATYFYRSAIAVRDATLHEYAAEEKLHALELEQLMLTASQVESGLRGSVFTLATQPLSDEERIFPNEPLRGSLTGRSIVVNEQERTRLKHQLRRKMIMLVGEGSLLVGLLLVCLVALYRMLVGELELRRQQESFVHAVTHELKSPLTGLRSLLQSLATLDIPKADRGTYLDLGVQEIDRLDQLVANILLSSRLEADAFRPRIETVDLTAELARVRDRQRHLFVERGGDLIVEGAALTAKTDAEALDLILRNLVENALKYSSEHPTVRLGLRSEGERALIDVRDNGVGLTPGDQARIFRKFYRARSGEQLHAKGSGLGLFIARGLARRIGGDLRVSSAGPGQGSTFTIELPQS